MQAIIAMVILLIVFVGVLIGLAMQGNVAAAYTLGLLTALLLHAVYSLFELARNRAQAKKEQGDFMANARENMAIMQAMQNLQNKQNQSLLSQLNGTPRYSPPAAGLLLDESIFDDLEG